VSPERQQHDLGVLFVHGIGEQERGSTLVQFGEPVYRWLDQWLLNINGSWAHTGLRFAQYREWSDRQFEARKTTWTLDSYADYYETLRRTVVRLPVGDPVDGAPRLDEITNDVAGNILAARVTLRDADARAEDDAAPSHARMELHAVATDGEPHTSSWLIAESWWAQTFFEPSSRELTRWLLTIIPWTLGAHFGTRARRALDRLRSAEHATARARAALDAFLNVTLLIASLPLAAVAETAVVLVILFSLIPIPKVRAVPIALERLLARTLGDSLVLVSSPLQEAAIVARVQRDVAWLAERCRSVAVVAHSQGAAVAHRALRHHRSPKVHLLVTFGSGLRKLEEMDERTRTGDGFFGPAYLTLASMALIAYSAWSALIWQRGWEPVTASVGALLFLFMLAFYLHRTYAIDLSWFASMFKQQGLWWIDYHATADPVPNGSLRDHEPDVDGPHAVPVCNERSFLRDHTTYWQNLEEFVGPVVWCLTRLVHGPWNGMVDQPPAFIIPAAQRRRWRVGALVAATWTGWVSLAALVAGRWTEWTQVLLFLRAWLATSVGALVPGGIAVASRPAPSASTWAGTVGSVLLLWALIHVVRLLWDRWNDLEQREYFERLPGASTTTTTVSWAWTFFTGVAALPIVAVALAPSLTGGEVPGLTTGGAIASGVGLAAYGLWVATLTPAIKRALQRQAASVAAKAATSQG
jgi:hypothetical protein